MAEKPLALKSELKSQISKYSALYEYAKATNLEHSETFKEFLDDLLKLDAICIERNRY